METQNQPQTIRDLKVAGDELEPQAKLVFQWRRDEFRKMGYTMHQSVELAYSRVDVKKMQGLVLRGATLDQASRILAGTDFLGDEADESRLLSPSDQQKRARRDGKTVI